MAIFLTRDRPKKIFIFGVPDFFFIGLRPSETNRKDEKKIIHTTRPLSCTCLFSTVLYYKNAAFRMLRGKTSNIRNAFLLLICNFLKKLKTKSNHFFGTSTYI